MKTRREPQIGRWIVGIIIIGSLAYAYFREEKPVKSNVPDQAFMDSLMRYFVSPSSEYVVLLSTKHGLPRSTVKSIIDARYSEPDSMEFRKEKRMEQWIADASRASQLSIQQTADIIYDYYLFDVLGSIEETVRSIDDARYIPDRGE